MQLYSSSFSPYASRCRIQIFHKQLPVEIVPPAGGMGSAEHKAKNPVGKIPVLIVGDDSLAESWAILEYLEARHPTPAMRPADALAAARLTELVRFCDLYFAPTTFPIFLALRGKATTEQVADALKNMATQMALLDALLAKKLRADGIPLDLADAALLPVVWYARLLSRHFGVTDCLAAAPAVTRWWQAASAVPAAATVLAEMEAGLKAAIPALFPSH